VEVGDGHLVVLVVVGEEELVERLRHVVDAAGVGREEDLLLDVLAVRAFDLHAEVALGDLQSGSGAVAVHAHRPEVHDVGVQAGLDDRGEKVVRRVDVVVDRVALVPRALHGVRRGTLLREVDDRVGPPVADEVEKLVVVLCDVQTLEADLASGLLAPRGEPHAERSDRRQRRCLEFRVRVPPREVVDDQDLMASLRQMQRRRPAAEAVPTQDQYPHTNLSLRRNEKYASAQGVRW